MTFKESHSNSIVASEVFENLKLPKIYNKKMHKELYNPKNEDEGTAITWDVNKNFS